ncbi:long-chain fatty acid--CoA ligase [Anaerosporomusa subterranea]|uniref:Long-chain fatty acid--CoA ligase n=1 Tax=Anaerosporomusa subterranea TaxID=1794912 RepID=A0A154BWD6_ANASB|nr:long-chain-fatty-acid--CoA ligase [Anaerosporomusa subterranea]KYZ78100.1 long-chain fatty acid--CoA ligase [Anaerosporomusa subterranea]
MLVHELITQGIGDNTVLRGNQTVTYAQLQDEVAKYRGYFQNSGIRFGDNVGLFSRNSFEYVYSYMALASLGAVVVPLNFQLTPHEVAYIIKDAQIKHLVTMEELAIEAELQAYEYQQEVTQLIIAEFSKDLPQSSVSARADIDENQPCVIIYTSGTTGNPKGAVLSHKNLVSDAIIFGKVIPVNSQDNVLCVLPMYHAFAWTCAVLNPLLKGASITVLDGFSPKETISTIKEQAVTVMYGVPPMYNLFVRMGAPEDLASVRMFISGGASLPESVSEQFQQKYGVNIIEGYGLSEASPVVAVNPVTKTKSCSIGKALPGLEVKVIGLSGEQLPPGTVGELVVKGPTVMRGYYNLPLDTARALKDGWLYTGDLAYRDTEGYLFIVDRLKDMIITNGENIYPREIEELLYAFPGVAEAAVIGVPDTLRGQAARAYIVMVEGHVFDKKAIREYLQVKLASYKMPRDYIKVDALPKSQTGKILKRVLREQSDADSRVG